MTKRMQSVIAMALAAAMGIALTAGSAFARTSQVIRFSLAQETSVKGVMMPAGTYTLRDMGLSSGVPLVQIRADGAPGLQVTTFADMRYTADQRNATQSRIKLRYDGSVYRLESIKVAGSNMSYHLSADPEQN